MKTTKRTQILKAMLEAGYTKSKLLGEETPFIGIVLIDEEGNASRSSNSSDPDGLFATALHMGHVDPAHVTHEKIPDGSA